MIIGVLLVSRQREGRRGGAFVPQLRDDTFRFANHHVTEIQIVADDPDVRGFRRATDRHEHHARGGAYRKLRVNLNRDGRGEHHGKTVTHPRAHRARARVLHRENAGVRVVRKGQHPERALRVRNVGQQDFPFVRFANREIGKGYDFWARRERVADERFAARDSRPVQPERVREVRSRVFEVRDVSTPSGSSFGIGVVDTHAWHENFLRFRFTRTGGFLFFSRRSSADRSRAVPTPTTFVALT